MTFQVTFTHVATLLLWAEIDLTKMLWLSSVGFGAMQMCLQIVLASEFCRENDVDFLHVA